MENCIHFYFWSKVVLRVIGWMLLNLPFAFEFDSVKNSKLIDDLEVLTGEKW